ncbi:hypothetical protein GQ53DRAFT_369928 [Thozetella sp. PMI_491]|nr:hypothetical protein GQ53DRAFT_369928 [Thozetella sp. PMI_491]
MDPCKPGVGWRPAWAWRNWLLNRFLTKPFSAHTRTQIFRGRRARMRASALPAAFLGSSTIGRSGGQRKEDFPGLGADSFPAAPVRWEVDIHHSLEDCTYGHARARNQPSPLDACRGGVG